MKYTVILFFLLLSCSENQDPQKKSKATSWTFSVNSTATSPSFSGEFQTEGNKVLEGGTFSISSTKYLVIEVPYTPPLPNDYTQLILQTKLVDGSNPEAYLQFTAEIYDTQIKASGVVYYLYSTHKTKDLPNFVINKM